MKGVIFNVAEEAVIDLGGEDLWDELVDAAGVSGAYTSLGNYPDEELVAIVKAASDHLGISVEETLVTVGRAALPHLANRAPEITEQAADAIDFLTSVHDTIHVEVRKLYANAEPPSLTHETREDGALVLRYESSRHLEDLAHGLILGVGDLFNSPLELTQEADGDATIFVVKVPAVV